MSGFYNAKVCFLSTVFFVLAMDSSLVVASEKCTDSPEFFIELKKYLNSELFQLILSSKDMEGKKSELVSVHYQSVIHYKNYISECAFHLRDSFPNKINDILLQSLLGMIESDIGESSKLGLKEEEIFKLRLKNIAFLIEKTNTFLAEITTSPEGQTP